MEAQIPPAKIARFADSGMLSMEMPSTGLGLGLGSGLENGKSAFTFLQLQELEHQALIFKYMVAGVPVPFHLVLPIWKSVASSSSGMYNPTWLGYNSVSLDYRNSMEPEPGRCRRTDGKKWRCSKDVVPDQKYCERHMHRGRQRSRKPVEGQAAATNTTTTTTTNTVESSTDSNTHLSISIPVGLELMTASTAAAAATNSNQNTDNSISISPSLGFSPTSVLQSNTCRTERSL